MKKYVTFLFLLSELFALAGNFNTVDFTNNLIQPDSLTIGKNTVCCESVSSGSCYSDSLSLKDTIIKLNQMNVHYTIPGNRTITSQQQAENTSHPSLFSFTLNYLIELMRAVL